MSKLSLNALKERAEAVASLDLLNSISGGIANACHVTVKDERYDSIKVKDATYVAK